MNPWRPYPLLRILFPFLAGIIAGRAFEPGDLDFRWLAAFPVLLLVTLLIVGRLFAGYRYRAAFGGVVNLFFFVSGCLVHWQHEPARDPAWFGFQPEGTFLVSVAEPPSGRPGRVKCCLDVRYRRKDGKWTPVSGKAVGYLVDRPGAAPLQYGDRLLVRAGFDLITDNSNPHSFNYMKYLAGKGIRHRVYAGDHEWVATTLSPSGRVQRIAFAIRDRLLGILRANGVEGREFAVAGALLLGYVEEIDDGLRNDYAATGAMHILSVSGMHVGIIYLFLELSLGFLNRWRAGRLARALMILLLIWIYAFLTGLSPCVLRAAAMLSLPVIGKAMGRTTDMFNVMAASVILMLLPDPFLVADIGFLLSYLAVAGIVVMYKPVYDLYITSAWLPDKAWSVIAVSLVAQVATLPLTLYVFHQFPNYFLLANLVVVPLSGLVIYAGIVALIAGGVPVAGMICAKILAVLIGMLNSIIHFLGNLPGAVTGGVFLSFSEMLMLYASLVALILFFAARRWGWMHLFLLILIALNLSFFRTRLERSGTSRIVVFNAGKEALYMVSCGDRAVLFRDAKDSIPAEIRERTDRMVKNALDGWGIGRCREAALRVWPGGRAEGGTSGRVVRMSGGHEDRQKGREEEGLPVRVCGRFIEFAGQRVVVISGEIPDHLQAVFPVDIVILSGNPGAGVERIVALFHPGVIVGDGTNARWRTLRWEREAGRLGVRFHAVAVQGAFQKEF